MVFVCLISILPDLSPGRLQAGSREAPGRLQAGSRQAPGRLWVAPQRSLEGDISYSGERSESRVNSRRGKLWEAPGKDVNFSGLVKLALM